MRIGLKEMMAFSKLLFPSVKYSTFFESCGVADLITTCSKDNEFQNCCFNPTFFFLIGYLGLTKTMLFVTVGGRNRKVAAAYARNGGKRFCFSLPCTHYLRGMFLKTRPKPTVQLIEPELRVGFICTIVWLNHNWTKIGRG